MKAYLSLSNRTKAFLKPAIISGENCVFAFKKKIYKVIQSNKSYYEEEAERNNKVNLRKTW